MVQCSVPEYANSFVLFLAIFDNATGVIAHLPGLTRCNAAELFQMIMKYLQLFQQTDGSQEIQQKSWYSKMF